MLLYNNQQKSYDALAVLSKCDDVKIIQDIIDLIPKSVAASHLPIYERVFQFQQDCGMYPDLAFIRNIFPDYQIPDFTGEATSHILLDFVQSLRKEVRIQEAEEQLSRGEFKEAIETLGDIRMAERLIKYGPHDALEEYEKEAAQGTTGVYSNIHCLDQYVRGFMYGTTTTVAAPPSMFKTTFAVNTCYAALCNGFKCLFITLEIQKKNMMYNFFARHAAQMGINLPAELIHKASVSKENFPLLKKVIDDFNERYGDNLYLLDHSDINSFEEISLVQTLTDVREILGGLDVVLLDYVQLIRNYAPPKNKRDSTEFVNSVISNLNALSKKFGGTGFIVFLLSQVNREGMKNMNKSDGKKGMGLESLAEFNALDRDSHYAIFLFSSPQDRSRSVLYIQLVKNRTGPVHPEPQSVSVMPEFLVVGIRQEGDAFSLDNAKVEAKEQMRALNEKVAASAANSVATASSTVVDEEPPPWEDAKTPTATAESLDE
jgi:hypothetical protein